MYTCAVVLAGGKSSRMGTNKSLLTINNKKVIQQIVDELEICADKVILITNEPALYDFLHVDIYSDRYTDKGPLAGLEAALYYVEADAYMVAACDMPFINGQVYNDLLGQLENYDAVVPMYNNQLHPLSGIYRKNVLPAIQQQLIDNNLKVKGFFEHIKVNYRKEYKNIPMNILKKHFFNMNNPQQYEEAKRF